MAYYWVSSSDERQYIVDINNLIISNHPVHNHYNHGPIAMTTWQHAVTWAAYTWYLGFICLLGVPDTNASADALIIPHIMLIITECASEWGVSCIHDSDRTAVTLGYTWKTRTELGVLPSVNTNSGRLALELLPGVEYLKLDWMWSVLHHSSALLINVSVFLEYNESGLLFFRSCSSTSCMMKLVFMV